MEKNYTSEDFVKENKKAYFFYKLYNAKFPKSFDKKSIDFYRWAIPHYTGLAYYNWIHLRSIFFPVVTKYFPFSLLFKNRLGHYSNRGVKRLLDDIENEAKKAGYSAGFIDNNPAYLFNEFSFYFTQNVENYDKAIHLIEKQLQKKYKDVYVRGAESNKFTIIISSDKFLELIKQFEKV